MADDDQVGGRTDALLKKCFPCLSKGTRQEAGHYCHECRIFFCTNCIDQHNGMFSNHILSDTGSTHIPDQCREHGKVKDLYCREDKTAGCDTCISSRHGCCKDVVYLPKLALKVIEDSNIDEIKTDVKEAIQRLQSIELTQQATIADIESDRDKCMQEINGHYNELLILLEKIVKSSKDKVEQTFERLNTALRQDHRELKQCLGDIESSDKQLKQGSDVHVFMELDKHQSQMKASRDVLSKSMNNLKVVGFSVTFDQRLWRLLSELDSLSTVMLYERPGQMKSNRVNISDKNDKVICHVTGACAMPDGSVVLVDQNNKMLKRLNHQTLKVTDRCEMEYPPRDICCADSDNVAVTQSNNKIALVTVNPRLSTTRTIKLNHKCVFLAYSNGELFINDEAKTIYVYNMDGFRQRTIKADPTGHDIFSRLRHLAVSNAGDKLYVTDADNGLITLDKQGKVLEKIVVKDKIPDISAICVDNAGGLFVSGFSSHNVVYADRHGKKLVEILTGSYDLIDPLSVCYDRVNKRLFVSQSENDELHVCEFE